jgi:hypothetical protein
MRGDSGSRTTATTDEPLCSWRRWAYSWSTPGAMSIAKVQRRQILCVMLCIGVLFSVTACDGVVVIEGQAESATGRAIDDCEALLVRADGSEVGRRPIDSDFSATFTVMPGKREYFAEITCEGFTTFRSKPFTSEGVLGDPPAQLGEIVLEPLPDGGDRSPRPAP